MSLIISKLPELLDRTLPWLDYVLNRGDTLDSVLKTLFPTASLGSYVSRMPAMSLIISKLLELLDRTLDGMTA